MGCLRVTATRVASNVSVEVSRVTEAPSVSLTKIGGVRLSTSLVCSTSSASGVEMWYCAGWRVLWNNGVKTLWKN